jgi:hypothetical protein
MRVCRPTKLLGRRRRAEYRIKVVQDLVRAEFDTFNMQLPGLIWQVSGKVAARWALHLKSGRPAPCVQSADGSAPVDDARSSPSVGLANSGDRGLSRRPQGRPSPRT